eukprot:5008841-Pleurochrysis_carterae.AAC.2
MLPTRWTGCSLIWDKFRTSTDRLVRVSCCPRPLCAFGSVWNDFNGHAKCTSGAQTSLLAPCRFWPYKTLLMLTVVPVLPEATRVAVTSQSLRGVA